MIDDERHIDPRDEFLALILGGCTPGEAADIMGVPQRYFRKLRNPSCDEYDQEFDDDYRDLMQAYWLDYNLRLRSEAAEQAKKRF